MKCKHKRNDASGDVLSMKRHCSVYTVRDQEWGAWKIEGCLEALSEFKASLGRLARKSADVFSEDRDHNDICLSSSNRFGATSNSVDKHRVL